MSDLKRWADVGGGADDNVRALLETASDDDPRDDQAQQIWLSLGPLLGPGGPPAPPSPPAPQAPPTAVPAPVAGAGAGASAGAGAGAGAGASAGAGTAGVGVGALAAKKALVAGALTKVLAVGGLGASMAFGVYRAYEPYRPTLEAKPASGGEAGPSPLANAPLANRGGPVSGVAPPLSSGPGDVVSADSPGQGSALLPEAGRLAEGVRAPFSVERPAPLRERNDSDSSARSAQARRASGGEAVAVAQAPALVRGEGRPQAAGAPDVSTPFAAGQLAAPTPGPLAPAQGPVASLSPEPARAQGPVAVPSLGPAEAQRPVAPPSPNLASGQGAAVPPALGPAEAQPPAAGPRPLAPETSAAVAPPSRAAVAPPGAPAARAPGAEPSGGRLAEESRLVVRARDEVRRGDAGAALRTLSEVGRRFPSGALTHERVALEVQALALSGRRAEARDKARAFSGAHPTSPLASVVRPYAK